MSTSVRTSFKRTCEATVVTPSRAVTFVPGAAGAGEFWSPVVQQLPKTWDIDVIDLPGLGAVPARAGIGSYEDLVAYVRARTSRPSALVAQSMGAYIALSFALRYPDAVTHLVLVAATGGVDVSIHGGVDWRADYISAFPTAESWARASVPDLTDRLCEIHVPVLLIWAARDVLSPISVARTIEARLRRASLVTVDSDDHWVARQFSVGVAAAIQLFVEREPS
jgi:pimeloyl-ACP methyl ester carboxylesterase